MNKYTLHLKSHYDIPDYEKTIEAESFDEAVEYFVKVELLDEERVRESLIEEEEQNG